MKPACFEYFAPNTLAEAVALRDRYPGAAVLAGGQSLLPIMNFRLGQPDQVIDLGKVSELAYVDITDGAVVVGAMARQRELERNSDALRVNPLLGDTLRLVAHPVIRNRGTVGGSIAHADPAAELPTLLTCLDGSVQVAGPEGNREIAAAELFLFHLTTSIEANEVLASVRFPVLEPTSGWSFLEVTRRHGDFALAGVCAVVKLDASQRVERVRLAACGIATTPCKLTLAEDAILGNPPTEEAMRQAGKAATGHVTTGSDTQASVGYRRRLVEELVFRSLRQAVDRIHVEAA
ncbi:MAG: FAD binding domain-containing protein [Acidimicrobiales bacterium]